MPEQKTLEETAMTRNMIAWLAAASGLVGTVAAAQAFDVTGTDGLRLTGTPVASFNEPWAMVFLPDGMMLVTEKSGRLLRVSAQGKASEITGVPKVAYGGQGGLGDVVVDPGFADNGLVYLSHVEAGPGGTFGAVVVRGKLTQNGGDWALSSVERIWQQEPKVQGKGHFSHRIAFGPDGKLFITSGDRQKFTPAQDFDKALGKVIRLNDDGGVPTDNPWQDKGELAKTFWSMGHRNLLGIAFDGEGRLWTDEMGPRHGDELNLTVKGDNYGWPVVSEGDHYSGIPIPDHNTRPEFNAPETAWVPSIAPSSLVFYSGVKFPDWQGDALIGGLVSRALVRIEINGDSAREAARYEWGARVREVEQGPDGAIWVLEDGPDGLLIRFDPAG
jgi:glucose/arabinose dehydrogenase